MKKHKIVVNSNCYHGFSIDEAIEGIAKAGYHYIELTATKGWTEHVFPDMKFEELLRIKEKLKAYQLTPIAMSGHCNLMDEKRIEDFIKNIHLAHFFGCEYIVSSIGEAHLEDEETMSDERLLVHLKRLLPLLEMDHLQLVLEVHGDHGSGAVLHKLMAQIDSPHIKIAYDTANAVFYGNVNVVEDLRGCLEDVSYFHIKDKAGAQNEWNFPYLGGGTMDFKAIFALLEQAKNDAPLSIEIEFTQAGPKDLAEVNTAIEVSRLFLEKHGFSVAD